MKASGATTWILALALATACGAGSSGAGGARSPGAASARSTNGDAAIPAAAPLVIFLGDSITAGLRVAPEEAFPAVLQRTLAAAGHPFRLVNAGVSGDTSAGGLRRLDWLLAQKPALLVVELGGNDGLRGQPTAEIEARLREIVQRAQSSGARVLLLGLHLPPSLGADYTRSFAEMYAHIARELGCALVPFFLEGVGGDAELMQEDGIHPNRAGHARIAENLAPKLGELLDALATKD